MTRSARILFALALGVASLPAPAQAPPTVEVRAAPIPVSLDVQPRTFTVPQTLTVTWSAPPPATACVASGYWSGNKPPSGTEQIAGAVGDSLIALTCSGPPVPLMLSWINPTKNIDGSDYTDPKATEVYLASTVAGLPTAAAITVPYTKTDIVFSDLLPGTHHFATKAVNQADLRSALSASVSEQVVLQSGTATALTVTGTAAPPPPTGVVSISSEGYAVKANELLLDYVLDGVVGTVQLAAPCDETRQMGSTEYFAINRSKYVTWTSNRRPKTVVVQCGAPSGSATVTTEAAPIEEGE